ncbi:hypothetical protein MTR67_030661 [Solanum verrucosum]|uniref:Reverse transcriptase zinc-binding domain-containing protein n=1 Tax=Solanum verrucosum TaxID=315347 RepID=A0AAF0R801_SOLVR|nr:hypothetical protein MTR67_030661 [Solanum verrucosum]
MIWKVKVPFKVACSTLLLAKQATLTQDNLRKKGHQICSRCSFCECEIEKINHLFLHCRETVKLWQIFINLRGISWTMPRSVKEALACWNRDGNQSGHRGRYGRLSQPTFDGLHRWKGTKNVSKTSAALCRN